jgi:hypothetical protein
VLPGPAALDLKLQRQTQESANENDQAENDYVVEGGINHDRADDVSRNKEFQPQKNSSSHILTAKRISVKRAPWFAEEKPNYRDRRSNDHHGDPSRIDSGAYKIHDLSESCHDREAMLSARGGDKSKRKAGRRKRERGQPSDGRSESRGTAATGHLRSMASAILQKRNAIHWAAKMERR